MRRMKAATCQLAVVSLLLAALTVVGSRSAGAAIGQWSSSGPTGARVFALALDPSAIRTVYAGTTEGVFKTTDGGSSWAATGTLPTGMSVRSLAIDRNAPQTVYAGLGNQAGDAGAVFKTTDGGATWTQLSGFTANREVLSLAIDRNATQTVYAGTRFGGVYKSTDGGATWTPANTGLAGPPAGPSVIALAGDPTATPTTMYAGTATGVFRTTDGGATWTPAGLAGSIVRTLAIDPSGTPVVMYAGSAASGDTVHRVLKTTDGGTTWTEVSAGLPGNRIRALVIDRTRTETVYAGTEGGGVYRTIDGGTNWSIRNRGLTNLDVRALVMDRDANPTLHAGTNGGGVFSTTRSTDPIPDSAITAHPDPVTTETSATFAFASVPEGASFECSLDGSPFDPCTTPASYSGLQPGSHTFVVKAGADPTPATLTWEIRPLVGDLWPVCTPERTQFCVRHLTVNGVDQTGGGAWKVNAWLRDKGDGVYSAGWAVVPSNGEWDPSSLPIDAEFSINLGDLQPRYTDAIAQLRWLETSGTPDTGYVLQAWAGPVMYSWRLETSEGNCFIGECGGETTKADTEAFRLSGKTEDLATWSEADRAKFAGMWMATDAQHRTRPLYLDPGWSVDLGNPHLRMDGTPVVGWYRAFLPDTLLAASGTSRDEVALNGLEILGGADPVGASVTAATGGILIKIPQVHYSTTSFRFGGDGGSQIIGPPESPAGLTALPIDGGAVLEFEPTAFDGGSPVTGYTARCSAGIEHLAQTPRADAVTVSGLTNGETYACDVQAHNAQGHSDWTAPVFVTPRAGLALGAIDGRVTDENGDVFGVAVFLESPPRNGVPDVDEVQATTNELGAYRFDELPAGAYTVDFVVPDGYAAAADRPVEVHVDPSQGGARADFSIRRTDGTPPLITHQISGTLGNDGWYTGDVTVSFSVVEGESPFSTEGCEPRHVTSDTAGMTFECTAVSDGGSSSDVVTIKRDATLPAFELITVTPNPVSLNALATVTATASDALSGVTVDCDTPATNSVGHKTVGCRATDGAGNAATGSAEYDVVFPFAGFFSPVDNQPTFNVVKAGSAVPVRFSLGGDRGLGIFESGFPRAQASSCDATQQLDGIEETVPGAQSGLKYDAATGQYVYVWKTEKSWAGGCRVLVLKFTDGTYQRASFKFTK